MGVCKACTSPLQCASHLCVDGVCVYCRFDSQCGGGNVCKDGICTIGEKGAGTTGQLLTNRPPRNSNDGPEVVIVIATGAAAGMAFVRRRRG